MWLLNSTLALPCLGLTRLLAVFLQLLRNHCACFLPFLQMEALAVAHAVLGLSDLRAAQAQYRAGLIAEDDIGHPAGGNGFSKPTELPSGVSWSREITSHCEPQYTVLKSILHLSCWYALESQSIYHEALGQSFQMTLHWYSEPLCPEWASTDHIDGSSPSFACCVNFHRLRQWAITSACRLVMHLTSLSNAMNGLCK